MTTQSTTKKLTAIQQTAMNEAEKVKIGKVKTLIQVMESYRIDEDKTILGSDHQYNNTFDEAEVLRLKSKLFELVKEF